MKPFLEIFKILEEKEIVLEIKKNCETTYYMENTYYACYILYHFHYKPKDLAKLKKFILSCWNVDGGFGRNSQGIFFRKHILCFMDPKNF